MLWYASGRSPFDPHDGRDFLDTIGLTPSFCATKFGSAQDFLGLTDDEAEYIELQLSLAALLRKRRQSVGYTQTEVADLIGSSQSRVAKMEAGDPSVSVDLLIRTLLALGVNRKQVGRAIGAIASAQIPPKARNFRRRRPITKHARGTPRTHQEGKVCFAHGGHRELERRRRS